MVISILHLKENHQKIPLWFWNDKGTGLFLKKKKTWDIVETEQRTGRVTAQLNGALGKLHIRFDRKASMLTLFTMFTRFGKYKNDTEDHPWSTCWKNLNELRTEQHRRGVFSCRTDWVCISQLSSAPVLCSRLLLLQLVATAVGSAALLTGIQIKTGVQQAHKENKKWN